MRIAILAPNGKYIAAESDGAVNANRDSIGPWEAWTVERAFGDTIHLKSHHGLYLCAEEAGGFDVNANRPHAGAWESWRMDVSGGVTEILARDGQHFLTVGSHDRVDARGTQGTTFGVVVIDADTISVPRLHVDGQDFVTAGGHRHVIIGSTELMLAHLYDTEGEAAVRPIMEERRDLRFNNIRVLWQKDVRNQNQPWLMPLDKIPTFLALGAEHGFHTQGCILADCQVVNPNESDQQRRVADVRRVTAGIDAHIEQLGNEFGKNGFNPSHFTQPTDRLSTRASGDDGFTDPLWDFFTFSGERGPEQKAIREYGPLEVMYARGKPAICDEGMVPGENSSNPRDFERAGAQARSGAGGRFHSRAGSNRDAQMARLFTPLERACADAFVSGLIGD